MESTRQDDFSIHAQMFRQIQVEYGNEPCFATPTAENCSKEKKESCSWSDDCYHEAEQRGRLNG